MELASNGLIFVLIADSVAVELMVGVQVVGAEVGFHGHLWSDDQRVDADFAFFSDGGAADWADGHAWVIKAGLAEDMRAVDRHFLEVVLREAKGADDSEIVSRCLLRFFSLDGRFNCVKKN